MNYTDEIAQHLTEMSAAPEFKALCEAAEDAAFNMRLASVLMKDRHASSLRDGRARTQIIEAMAQVGKVIGGLARLKLAQQFHPQAADHTATTDAYGTEVRLLVPPGPDQDLRDHVFTTLDTCETMLGYVMLQLELETRIIAAARRARQEEQRPQNGSH
ncbi:hypothetical protein [Neoroseomonas soli]|uniref:Uncharacterized protein n=1 Tax=Neoroseomonas soli TaxID=1081025 RepID=A0A9X9X0I3_9PROT|nr:hypothetical protein [Neoroseomonas soli]MBR0672912.1 hypothetical protein [Neoroseomonas soli]